MQKKHRISYALICLIIVISLVGCSKKIEPFAHSPENDLKVDYMEEIIQDQAKFKGLYKDYASMRIAGALSEELDKYIEDLKANKSEEEAGKFADNGDKYIAFKISLETYKEDIDKGAKDLVDNYLKNTRLGDEKATDFGLTTELKAQDPVGKVKKYMEDNKIEITDIVLPEAFEKADYDLYPLKYTYRYVLKGTVNKKPFEKEVVQDFYIGIDWSEGKENIKDVIEYIRDIS